MEFKGTKGEWDWEENSASQVDGSTCIEGHIGGGPQIAYLQSFVGWGADYERNATIANANLIAAAPELLDALQAMLNKAYKQNWNEQYPDEISAARAAIAKAIGKEE